MQGGAALALDEVEVLDPAGATVRLKTLWADRCVLLALVRHFG